MNHTEKKQEGGFTLLELLIVISIIAILSVALVFILNPAETLKKSRDAQRISDLSTLKTALGLYLTSTTTPYLGSLTANTACRANNGTAWTTNDKIFYSYSAAPAAITDTTLDGATVASFAVSTTTPSLTDSTGWIPVNFDTLSSGSPISNLPLDPVNTIADVANVASTDYVYRYGCMAAPLSFEINAQLESEAYTVTDDKRTKDGGNNSNFYEVGTNLKIFGTGSDF